jgi:Flp pilus assembly protein TadD
VQTKNKLHPSDAPRLAKLAAHYYTEGDFENAETSAALAATADPKTFAAWLTLGLCHARQNNHEDAVAAYLKALALQPNDVACWTDLGEIYLSLVRYEAAAAALRQAMLLDPKAAHPAGRRARAIAAQTMAQLKKGGS